jgi:GMP reductase
MQLQQQRFDFKDINLIPRKCIVNSRSQCLTSMQLGHYTFGMPVVPANMECIINDEIAMKLANDKYFYIHHRFNVDAVEFCKKMTAAGLYTSISIGVNNEAYATLEKLDYESIIPDYITIDIAHGHSVAMESMITFIRRIWGNNTFIIAGNVSTAEGTRDLELWGANAVKVGIGPGSACTTFTATGFGSRGCQGSVIRDCASGKLRKETVIIGDGGITDPGDIAKALVLGASMVMIGGMFSGLQDSPGAVITGPDGKLYKEFWGSASSFQSGKNSRIEGTKKLNLLKNRGILEEMNYLKECLQSAVSYGGGRDLDCFSQVKFF